MAGRKNYKDQQGTEIYDNYDRRHGEGPVPQILLDKTEGDLEAFGNETVHIEYPFDGIWALDGQIGYATWYAEQGKKAFIHGGFYEHPVKDYTVAIEMMYPGDYIEWCIELFNKHQGTFEREEIIDRRREEYDAEAIFGPERGNISYPVIETNCHQEGLHRAIWALDQGITEIPVIIIDQH